jgi:two-component system, OmpR family, KDP operon response regulator KdpE
VVRAMEAGTMRLTRLREAICSNRVSFPSQIPLFVRSGAAEVQLHTVQLYFLQGWNCGQIAKRYGCSRFHVWHMVSEWRRHAASLGYLQTIPPAHVLGDLKNVLQRTRHWTPKCVLVMAQEAPLRKVLRASLAITGFNVEEAGSERDAVGAIQQWPFDLVLLDGNTPRDIEICRRIRALAARTGIVMLMDSDTAGERVCVLEAGADDYLIKPFRLPDLRGRIGAVLRRVRAGEWESGLIEAGDIRLDLDRRLGWKKNRRMPLSPKEFALIAFLMRNQGVPITHCKLLREVWGPEYGGELEYLRTYICMLRKKVEDDSARPQYILTEAWVGYRFQDPHDRNPECERPAPAAVDDNPYRARLPRSCVNATIAS